MHYPDFVLFRSLNYTGKINHSKQLEKCAIAIKKDNQCQVVQIKGNQKCATLVKILPFQLMETLQGSCTSSLQKTMLYSLIQGMQMNFWGF